MGFANPNKEISYKAMERLTREDLVDLIKSPLVHSLGYWNYTQSTLCDILNYELNGNDYQ